MESQKRLNKNKKASASTDTKMTLHLKRITVVAYTIDPGRTVILDVLYYNFGYSTVT